MTAVELIKKKRDGGVLSAEEIAFLVRGIVSGEVSEAQTGAFLMAAYLRGLSPQETVALTLEMASSGEMLDLSRIPGTVDKHSTGGVGDKTTLVVAPLVAAAGVPVPKLSGGALGHTGGTVDRWASIPGFRTDLTTQEFIAQLAEIGVAVGGHTSRLAPADKKVYALRDQTATVDSVPLIAASVMSKKLACGAAAILLDVKCGRGAFVTDPERAKELAMTMVEIGQAAGRRMRALITAMDQPLGKAVGEGLETAEAIMTLRGEGPADFLELCLLVSSHMVHLGGKADSPESARPELEQLLQNGAALAKLRQLVIAQDGEAAALDDPEALGRANHRMDLISLRNGYVQQINARTIGEVARALVRNHKGGVLLERKVGDKVEEGEVLAQLSTDLPEVLPEALARVDNAYLIGESPPQPPPLLLFRPLG